MAEKSTFLLLKGLSDPDSSDIGDDATIIGGNCTQRCNTQRMTIMFQVPTVTEGEEDDQSAIEAINKMNLMIKTLVNKLPKICIGP